jgi:hypothetical protein
MQERRGDGLRGAACAVTALRFAVLVLLAIACGGGDEDSTAERSAERGAFSPRRVETPERAREPGIPPPVPSPARVELDEPATRQTRAPADREREREIVRYAYDPDEDDVPPELRRLLESSYAVDRAEAIAEVDPYGTGLTSLVGMLTSDPDAHVRATAARQLGDSDTQAAVVGLVRALDDRDARVVAAASESLGEIGDETLIPFLVPLLSHPDEDVRQTTAATIELLE